MSNTPYCSFCGKSQHEVQKLIGGPPVLICNECTDLVENDRYPLSARIRALLKIQRAVLKAYSECPPPAPPQKPYKPSRKSRYLRRR